jgi:cytosine/adenosine deaminase-related metal-dependent hydrolase
MITELSDRITIGTDSLASNNKLSILDELKTLQLHSPDICFEKMLAWACINGAIALNISNIYGSFEVGKKPGVLLLDGFNFTKMTIAPETRVKRLC